MQLEQVMSNLVVNAIHACAEGGRVEVCCGLRDEGVVPEGVRFQVTFPGTGSAISYFFREEDWPAAHAAYHDAIRRDIELICEHVPLEDLQIQFDIYHLQRTSGMAREEFKTR